MPDALAASIRAARGTLAQRDDGHLPRPARAAVLDVLGPDDPADAASYPRLVAQAAIIERALPVWLAERPGDDRPAALMRAALGSPSDLAAARQPIEDLERAVQSLLGSREISDEAGAVATAAIALVETAAFGFGGEAPESADDEELDPDVWAPEYHAEMALAGMDPAFRADERRALWSWWLDEVVPVVAASPSEARRS